MLIAGTMVLQWKQNNVHLFRFDFKRGPNFCLFIYLLKAEMSSTELLGNLSCERGIDVEPKGHKALE